MKMFKTGDLVKIQWVSHGRQSKSLLHTDIKDGDLVTILAGSPNEYVKILHPQFGIKWIGIGNFVPAYDDGND